MVHFSYYPFDARPRREAETLADDGFAVDVICLRGPDDPFREVVSGLTLYRLPIRQKRQGLLRYFFEYAAFSFLTFLLLTVLHIRKRYDVIHIHNMPDFLVFCAIIPRTFGASIILDLHDPVPEVFITKYGLAPDHRVIRFLIWVEKISIAYSQLILTPNIMFRELFISRSCPPEKIHIVMNSPDEKVFFIDEAEAAKKDNSRFVLMFHGFITERHGLGIALEAVARLRHTIPNIMFRVYGEGDYAERFLEKSKELNITDIIEFGGLVTQEVISGAINTIDVGIIPNLNTPFTAINFPTRIFEFLCMGKPVIVPRTPGIQDYFDEESIHYFDPGNVDDLVERIRFIYENPELAKDVLERGMRIYNAHRWSIERDNFVNNVRKLVEHPRN